MKWIIGGAILLLIIGAIGSHNNLVGLNEAVDTEYSNISVQLERRISLIPNLVNTVKGYAEHEKEIFANVSEARQNLMNAGSVAEKAAANAEVTSALGRLFAISEAYPELKANENFIRLQDELAGTENRIAVARRDYNNATRKYNAAIKSIPGVFFANYLGFTDKDYFQASQGAEELPQVNF